MRAAAVGCELAAEAVGRFGRVSARAVGISMVPAIFPGDILLIDRVNPAQLSTGDVLVLRRNDRLVVHRLVRSMQAGGAILRITRGDRLRRCDPPFSEAELVGRVACLERRGVVISLRSWPLWQRLLGRLLSFSEFAAFAYLRLARLGRPDAAGSADSAPQTIAAGRWT